MKARFFTEDDTHFEVDTVRATWSRLTSVLATTDGAPGVVEEGKIVPQGMGIYLMAGRNPKFDGPGGGLCTIGIMAVPVNEILNVYLRANVPVKDFTMPIPITGLRCITIPVAGRQQGQAK